MGCEKIRFFISATRDRMHGAYVYDHKASMEYGGDHHGLERLLMITNDLTTLGLFFSLFPFPRKHHR